MALTPLHRKQISHISIAANNSAIGQLIVCAVKTVVLLGLFVILHMHSASPSSATNTDTGTGTAMGDILDAVTGTQEVLYPAVGAMHGDGVAAVVVWGGRLVWWWLRHSLLRGALLAHSSILALE